jgi:hypothetical protein
MFSERDTVFDRIITIFGLFMLAVSPFGLWWALSEYPSSEQLSSLDVCEKSLARDRIVETQRPLNRWGLIVVSHECEKRSEVAPVINEQLRELYQR